MKWDQLWINARLATMREECGPYGVIENAAFAGADGHIVFAGPMADLPGRPDSLADKVIDAHNDWITPGLIDCHTHLVFAANRAGEFEQRLQGRTYEDIARSGGGIMSTVRATREASDADLLSQCTARLTAMAAEGVTTVEIKSGYGLDRETELRMLRLARNAGVQSGLRTVPTYLGLHALPPGVPRAEFGAEMSGPVLRAIVAEGLADSVDAFCEGIAFTSDEVAAFFKSARALGLKVRLHADQLSDTGGAALAARFRALSADHLEFTSPEGVRAMAAAGTVAVLLPGAFHCLRETRLPPIEAFRQQGVPMAVATDCNPGTSPVVSLLAAMGMACTHFRMTPEEVLAGVTRHAARALGRLDSIGTLETGKAFEYAVWRVSHPAELCYWIGGLKPVYARAVQHETP